ncbi:hypothetical protein [Candidatus Amarolinea dominans]|uniref:hypothetical protein n=1 Tax=Candidatus Amarolinea dominans TaxID=3140696 RepID=UPI0031368086|nr:hypothetical protein [Anaerolineae bacterium]MBK9095900.1 hypothetical protein [Anaerolineae bacterium]MBK9229985.1 hypothetical protein [Anaerolineae bacterium]
MRVNPFVYGILILTLFFGVIGGAKAAGFWSISGRMTSAGGKVLPTGANAEEIKGWMTLDDVSAAYKVPVAEMLAALNLPTDTPGATQIKSLESDTFSTADLRAWLAARAGSPAP